MIFEQYAVIFDVDGVLIDSGPIHYKSWKKLADEIGIPFTKQYFDDSFGKQGIPTLRNIVGKNISEKQLLEWVELKEVYYREMVKNKLIAMPGVITLIKELKENSFKLAVATSGPPENTDLLLKTIYIDQFFDQIITAADIKKGKPAPDIFLMVSKNLNILPKNCLVIEDAPVGIEAAKKAGMKCIALTTTYEVSKLNNADMIIDSLSEINTYDIIELIKL
ncbi:MAG: HAD family phosphatase [Candidatus Lokiarchaeota archaeon]|nr:HAD family phosphatase [Candidatus Lokiarchaeota archaeon]